MRTVVFKYQRRQGVNRAIVYASNRYMIVNSSRDRELDTRFGGKIIKSENTVDAQFSAFRTPPMTCSTGAPPRDLQRLRLKATSRGGQPFPSRIYLVVMADLRAARRVVQVRNNSSAWAGS
jgi:hypothetical protein